MVNENTKNIVLPKSSIRAKEGVVILPLKKWREVEEALEDLEMYRSEALEKEIKSRRKKKETVPLEKVLQKHHI